MAAVSIEDEVIFAAEPQVGATQTTGPTAGAVKRVVARLLAGRDPNKISLRNLRKEVEERLGVVEGSLTARKDEIRAAAQAFFGTDQQPPPSTAPPVAAPSVSTPPKAASLAVEASPERITKVLVPAPAANKAGQKRGAESQGVDVLKPAKAHKKAHAMTGSRVFNKEMWNAVSAELATDGTKPSMGKVRAELSSRWQALTPEKKAQFEDRAAKMESSSDALKVVSNKVTPESQEGGRGRGRGKGGRGKGNGRGEGDEAGQRPAPAGGEFTRADFQGFCKVLQARIACDDAASEGACEPLLQCKLYPRAFKTGTVGWFVSTKLSIPMGDAEDAKKITCQAQLSLMVTGSKAWLDGEGYSADSFPTAPPEDDNSSGAGRGAADAAIGHDGTADGQAEAMSTEVVDPEAKELDAVVETPTANVIASNATNLADAEVERADVVADGMDVTKAACATGSGDAVEEHASSQVVSSNFVVDVAPEEPASLSTTEEVRAAHEAGEEVEREDTAEVMTDAGVDRVAEVAAPASREGRVEQVEASEEVEGPRASEVLPENNDEADCDEEPECSKGNAPDQE